MVQAGVTQKLSEHVYAIADNSVPGVPNVGFVVGADAILVIDTGMGAPNGQIVLAEAQKLGPGKKLYLVTTHVHPEHDLGAQTFPASTVMIRSNAQVREIADEGMRTADIFRGRSDINKRLLEGAEFRKADITFDGAYKPLDTDRTEALVSISNARGVTIDDIAIRFRHFFTV